MKFYKEGGYLAINLFCKDDATPTLKALQAFRLSYHEQEWGWGHGREVNDPFQSTLILLGLRGTFSGFHVDWSEAFNIALLLTGVRPSCVSVGRLYCSHSSLRCDKQLACCLANSNSNACVNHLRHIVYHPTTVHLFCRQSRTNQWQDGTLSAQSRQKMLLSLLRDGEELASRAHVLETSCISVCLKFWTSRQPWALTLQLGSFMC